ncbi:MAG: hypothetical protein ACRDPY_20110, partial [Streptosporangiaceae bacterium]
AVGSGRLRAVDPGPQGIQADVPAGPVARRLAAFGQRVGEDQQGRIPGSAPSGGTSRWPARVWASA